MSADKVRSTPPFATIRLTEQEWRDALEAFRERESEMRALASSHPTYRDIFVARADRLASLRAKVMNP